MQEIVITIRLETMDDLPPEDREHAESLAKGKEVVLHAVENVVDDNVEHFEGYGIAAIESLTVHYDND